ncbi:hypothetical protein BDZ90DRAFT_258182 [Jaminaea rosea]|uniref:Rnh202 triple barrel domain-containing protein n=1 Tax=Jaminaea rosea TaxID=1569628 RepID=A0A316V0S1_9BASI|nr:hypothetical protein BDZ90DRAFT_258182 [Jaminaea rosea]PWN31146.1 hypothetical protein BDZ90DRAFT_258182 [Jaminaea rosea]
MTTSHEDGRLIIAGPSRLVEEEQRFLLLPHPRTHAPAYFVMDDEQGEAYELQAVSKERRSWMLNGRQAAVEEGGQGWVMQDGSLHLLLPLDPIFLLLPLLPVPTTSSSYLTSDDIFDSAASRHYAARVKAYNALAGQSQAQNEGVAALDEDAGIWEDVVAFGRSKTAQKALERCCDVQAISPTLSAYRPSLPTLRSILHAKLQALCTTMETDYSATLGRTLAKRLEFNATEEQVARERIKLGKEVLMGYMSAEWGKMILDEL